MSRVQFNNMIFVVVLVVEKCLIRNSPLFELLAFSRVTVNVRKKEQHQRQFNELFSQQTYLQQRLLYSHTHTHSNTHTYNMKLFECQCCWTWGQQPLNSNTRKNSEKFTEAFRNTLKFTKSFSRSYALNLQKKHEKI